MLSDKLLDLRFANFVVRDLRDSRDRERKDFRCVSGERDIDVKVDNFGGAHIVKVEVPRCNDFDACKKCEKDCPNHDWNNGYIDLLVRLRNARHDRNWAIINLFFVTRKGAQLLKYVWLKHKVAKLSRECEGLSDKVIEMKPGGAQGTIILGEDGPNGVDLPGNESASQSYQDALDVAGQKKAEYDNAVEAMNAARGELLGRTK